jgi:hypothetical protein
LIERATRRFFEPRRRKILTDGTGSHHLTLDEAIIWLEHVGLASMFVGEPLEVNTTDVRVYNRHLLTGQLVPDDRFDPKIELLRFGSWTTELPASTAFVRWPKGSHNVILTGIWGYTDPDPLGANPVGITPLLVRHACKLIVMREFPQMTQYDLREDRQRRHRITGERTQGYSQELAAEVPDAYGLSAEVSNILLSFQRPAEIAVA